MLRYQYIGTFRDAQGIYARNVTDLSLAVDAQGATLYGVTHLGGGIGAFRVTSAETQARFFGGRPYTPSMSYLDSPKVELLTIGGQNIVVSTGIRQGVQSGVTLQQSGHLGSTFAFTGARLPNDLIELGQFSTVNGTFLYTARNDLPGYDIWSVGPNGALKVVDRLTLPIQNIPIDSEIDDMLVARAGTKQYVASVSAMANLVMIHEIKPDGSLGIVRMVQSNQGFGFDRPTQLEAVTVAGVVYLVVASGESSSLTTLRLTSAGNLVATDHIVDERTTRFQGATALETVMLDGRPFVFAGGADDGISVFTLMPDGRFIHLATIADQAGWSLADVGAITAGVVGDKIAVFVASKTRPGISQFSFDPGKIGLTATVGRGNILGSARNDLLKAGQGTLSIDGGAGDDILIVGDAPVALTGGAGADLFIAAPVKGRILIRDYQHGIDRLDLSNLGMIRSTMQLVMRPQNYGILITFGQTVIEIRSKDQKPLYPAQFTDEMFPHTHYTPDIDDSVIIGSSGSDTLYGGIGLQAVYGMGGNDVLIGTAAQDSLFGGAGNDTLLAGRGNDALFGGAGNDVLRGGDDHDALTGDDGNDTLWGEAGNDKLLGGSGEDVLWGGAGSDTADGGSGNDTIYGEDGHDLLNGQLGNDLIYGGDGNDTLLAMAGNNTLSGGAGNDVLNAGDGNDVLDGGAGNDTVSAGGGHDTVMAWAGNDVINGGWGNDSLHGGAGHDTIRGGAGNDTIFGARHDDLIKGEDGADLLGGGPGNDRVEGGAGNDTINGGLGSDSLYGGIGNDVMDGGLGDDWLLGGAQSDWLKGGTGNDTLLGDKGSDRIEGGDGADILKGHAGDDTLMGGTGNDVLNGGPGADRLQGGKGADTLTGGAGADVFVIMRSDFDGAQDVITDFAHGVDSIDMRGLGLRFIGNADFSAARQVRMQSDGRSTTVHIDIDGDGAADLSIRLAGLSGFSETDLLL